MNKYDGGGVGGEEEGEEKKVGSVKFTEMTDRPQGHTGGGGGKGCPLNNNHRYTSKTFPHSLCHFLPKLLSAQSSAQH